jgi:hypothetical protein
MADKAYVSSLPTCDFPHDGAAPAAKYDGKTRGGPWANMCEAHYRIHGTGLGTGKGQELIVGEPPARDREAEARAALLANDFEAFEDAVGDGDPLDFM